MQSDITPRPALGVRFLRGTHVVIGQVIPDSPADAAGLEFGDMILSFNGEPLDSSDEFITLVATSPLDAGAELVFVRGDDRHTITIDPAAWDAVYPDPYAVLRPDLDVDDDGDDDRVLIPPTAPRFHVPYHVTNVSPVVVPASWYAPYSYYYWGYYPAYYGWYPASYGYWPAYYHNVYAPGYYYHAPYYWPYYGNYPWAWGYGWPPPGPVPEHDADDDDDLESASRSSGTRASLDLPFQRGS